MKKIIETSANVYTIYDNGKEIGNFYMILNEDCIYEVDGVLNNQRFQIDIDEYDSKNYFKKNPNEEDDWVYKFNAEEFVELAKKNLKE